MSEWLTIPWIVLLLVGLAAVLYGTVAKTNWGVNLSPPKVCPKCGAPLASIRMPKTQSQALWGGWTCTACGAEIDKWGRLSSSS